MKEDGIGNDHNDKLELDINDLILNRLKLLKI